MATKESVLKDIKAEADAANRQAGQFALDFIKTGNESHKQNAMAYARASETFNQCYRRILSIDDDPRDNKEFVPDDYNKRPHVPAGPCEFGGG